ncbi:MAG: glycoside hydrolase family 27 protein [Agromyces sp.]
MTEALVAEPGGTASEQLAATPPMGWNSWNQVRCWELTEQLVRDTADQLVARGLDRAGYRYVVVDDCWQGGRDEHGVLFSDPKRFPSGIPALAEYVHGLGLQFGLYAVPGTQTCANYYDAYPELGLGSYGHERTDAESFAAWGVDYLKYDWCQADNGTRLTRPDAFSRMRDELARVSRPIVYAISEYGETEPWQWAASIANLWRTTEDIAPEWGSIARIIDEQAGLAAFARPGAWNDPDMLQFGNGDLTPEQNRSHFAMWCMLAAPLFLGTSVAALSDEEVAVLTNPELIAIDQDPLGRQARRVVDGDPVQVWVRELADGDHAVAFFNPSDAAAAVRAEFDELGITGAGEYLGRDVWTGAESTLRDGLEADVPAYGTRVLRLRRRGE